MNPQNIPEEIKTHINLCINNIRYLMFKMLDTAPKENRQRVADAFKRKLRSCVCMILNWYKVYIRCIPDAFLMLIEQEMKMNRLKLITNNRIQILNYDINKELYYFMNRVYNLYPNR